MPDSAVPVVRRPVRRMPSNASKESPELRRLSVGEASRGSSLEKENSTGRVLLRRSVKVKTVSPPKEETALQRIMRDDDLPPPFPDLSPNPTSPSLTIQNPAPTKSRRRVAKTCVSLFCLPSYLSFYNVHKLKSKPRK